MIRTTSLDDESRVTVECVERTLGGYIECALWSSTDEHGEPLDGLYTREDLTAETVEAMRADVRDFLFGFWDNSELDLTLEPEQIGHDFWLTRNHHGAGFWDRGLGELGDVLTAMSHPYGECDLYAGDDGKLYIA